MWEGALSAPSFFDVLHAGLNVRAYRGAKIFVGALRSGDLVLLDARPVLPVDRLTAREREVAGLYAAGSSNQEISAALRISPATVRNHLSALYRKLEISNKAQLIRQVDEARL